MAPAVSSHLDEPGPRHAQLRGYESILVIAVAAEYWDRAIKNWHLFDTFLIGSAVAVTGLGALVILGRRRRLAFAALALVVASFLAIVFPNGGNHEYLEFILCALSAGLNIERRDERKILTEAVRWLVCLILFWAGLQKLVHGYYLDGQYLAYSVSRESYRSVFYWLLPANELARLAAYDGGPGTGPFLPRGVLFSIASNLSWLLEILLAPLLLWSRCRRAAVIGVTLLMIAIQSAAREMFFFVILLDMLLLFVDAGWQRRLVVPAALLFGCLLLSRAGVLPEVTFN